jgi:L-lactate dehydrogenase complex protein LldF
MTDAFHSKIKQSLDNPNLQAALDGNAERRRVARETAYQSLPEDLQVMRQRAHEVRARTILNLDQYLAQFVENARVNGMIVHNAQDAVQARQIVLDIARERDARLVAKSKTMVGEEIEINRALEEAGIRAVETDLGEYIVQLRGEPPAHIITPAVHLRRAEVAETFQEKLGVPYDEDIPSMTETVRQLMRETFLKAEIGISGVNFAVAESGTLCLVTNEGNGRMVTTLPQVHIALLGIERLVPTLDDLALMLYLLPRSATGQKITVYTNLIHGPRRQGEVDGPDERHLILVDNGRSILSQSQLSEILYCIRCGACINVCPVFREIGGHAYVGAHGGQTPYPGPIGSVVSPGLFGQPEFGQLARATSLCGACKEACPVDIDLPKLLLRVRAGGLETEPKLLTHKTPAAAEEHRNTAPTTHTPGSLNAGLRLYSWLATSPRRFAAFQRLTGIGGWLLAPFSEWMKLPAFTGWGYGRDFPRPASTTFRERFAKRTKVMKNVKLSTGASETIVIEKADRAATNEANFSPIPSSLSTSPHSNDLSPLSPELPPASLLQRFEDELTQLGGTFRSVSADRLLRQVLSLLREREITAIQAWESSLLPDGLVENLVASGIEVGQKPHAGLKAGLTGTLAGVAETGTLVVPAGDGQPQTASLLPGIHIAVLRADNIYESLPQVLNLREVQDASSVAMISGPSRTADIEMTLTIGVHGPREVHVFCVR